MFVPGFGKQAGDGSLSFQGSLLTQNPMEALQTRRHAAIQKSQSLFHLSKTPGLGMSLPSSPMGPLWVNPAWECTHIQVDVGLFSLAGEQVLFFKTAIKSEVKQSHF